MPSTAKQKETEAAVERIIRNEILCCDSCLVDKLLGMDAFENKAIEGFQFEDIENTYPQIDDDWTPSQCLTFINGYEDIDDTEHDEDDEWVEHARETASENPYEILEWWRITRYLCERLRAIGEPVLDNDYGYWWGRTCSGQSIELDGTIQKLIGGASC